MGKIIAFANQKGGVGKTTTAVNLSAALAYRTRGRVLLVDSDPQGNATSGLGINKREVKHSVYDVVIGNCSAKEAVIRTKYKNLDIIPSSIDLAAAEIELVDMENRALRLKNALSAILAEYDYICIDCPPSLGLLTLNALAACTSILVPIQCEFYALEGLSQLMATVRTVKRLYNGYIDLEGVLLTMYDARLNLTMQVVEEVKKYFPQKVFKTVIPRNVRLSEAPSFGEPVIYYDLASKGSQGYLALADEIIANNRTEG
jgi:chromosome partitioning protein